MNSVSLGWPSLLKETPAFLETNPAAGDSRGQSVPPALGPEFAVTESSAQSREQE